VDAAGVLGVRAVNAVDPVEHLSAVAAAGAGAEGAGLEQHDAALGEAPGQVPGGRDSGEAAADDGHVRRAIGAQRWAGRVLGRVRRPRRAVFVVVLGHARGGTKLTASGARPSGPAVVVPASWMMNPK